jgi:hypothetical protein
MSVLTLTAIISLIICRGNQCTGLQTLQPTARMDTLSGGKPQTPTVAQKDLVITSLNDNENIDHDDDEFACDSPLILTETKVLTVTETVTTTLTVGPKHTSMSNARAHGRSQFSINVYSEANFSPEQIYLLFAALSSIAV